MFERIDVNDLYFASVDVFYPDTNWVPGVNVGGIFQMGLAGYGYLTVLYKKNDEYFDLSDMSRKIVLTRDPSTVSCVADYLKPFTDYYSQGEDCKTFSRKKALAKAKEYYDIFYQDYLSYQDSLSELEEKKPLAKHL